MLTEITSSNEDSCYFDKWEAFTPITNDMLREKYLITEDESAKEYKTQHFEKYMTLNYFLTSNFNTQFIDVNKLSTSYLVTDPSLSFVVELFSNVVVSPAIAGQLISTERNLEKCSKKVPLTQYSYYHVLYIKYWPGSS